MPWGQKKRMREMIHSQMVTPPLAAMDGTTLRLKTATTKSRTRSHRPRTRRRWGVAGSPFAIGEMASFDNSLLLTTEEHRRDFHRPGQAGAQQCCAPTCSALRDNIASDATGTSDRR